MGRAAMLKDARRQMRRAMGEEAVKQVEGQTTVLGLHEQRLQHLRDMSYGVDRELAKLHAASDNHAYLIDKVMANIGRLDERLDIDNKRINDLMLRVGDLERETSLWIRLKWLILGTKT